MRMRMRRAAGGEVAAAMHPYRVASALAPDGFSNATHPPDLEIVCPIFEAQRLRGVCLRVVLVLEYG